MAQVCEKNAALLDSAEIEIVLEKLPELRKQIEKKKVEDKQDKLRLLKLFNEAKYNAKYHEELIQIKVVKSQIHFRNSGVF